MMVQEGTHGCVHVRLRRTADNLSEETVYNELEYNWTNNKHIRVNFQTFFPLLTVLSTSEHVFSSAYSAGLCGRHTGNQNLGEFPTPTGSGKFCRRRLRVFVQFMCFTMLLQ